MIYKILTDTDPAISHNKNSLNKAEERIEDMEDLVSSNPKSPIPMSPPISKSPYRSSPSHSPAPQSPAPQSPTPFIISIPSRSPVTRIHIPNLLPEPESTTQEDLDAQEKRLKLKLMEIQIHKARLECLGLEQSLRLPPSTITKPLFDDN